MKKKQRFKFSSVMLCLFVLAAWADVSIAADAAFNVTAYYVKGFKYFEGGDASGTLSMDPVVSWQGAEGEALKYAWTIYKGKCDGEACSPEDLVRKGETSEKKLSLDENDCPGWDCTIKVEPLDLGGNPAGGPAYASPRLLTPSIPLVVVETDRMEPVCDDSTSKDTEVQWTIPGCYKGMDCSILIVKPDGAVEYDGQGEIEVNGNSSRSFPKRQYGLELEDDKAILGMREDDDWRLNGSWADRSLIANKLSYDLFTQMDPENNFGPRSRYMELFLNGEYQGVYLISEKVNRSRLKKVYDIKKDDDKKGDRFITKLIKVENGIDERGIYDYLDQEPVGNSFRNFLAYELNFPKEEDLTMFMELKIVRHLSSFHRTALSDGFDDPEKGIFFLLDRKSAMDFILIQDLIANPDGYIGSSRMVRPTGDLMRLIVWDMDLSFGNNKGQKEGEAVTGYDEFSVRPELFHRIQRMPGFQEDFEARWKALGAPGAVLSEEYMTGLIDCYTGGNCPDAEFDVSEGEVATFDAIGRNYERWPLDDPAYQSIMTGLLGVDDPGISFKVDSFESEKARIKEWLNKRIEFLNGPGGWPALLQKANAGDQAATPEGKRFGLR